MKTWEILIIVLCIAIGSALLASVSVEMRTKTMQDRAIEAGVAEWRIDKKTGERTFVYLGKKESDK